MLYNLANYFVTHHMRKYNYTSTPLLTGQSERDKLKMS